MKPLGIVLLFLNLLAAAAVAYLAAKSWATRHDQNIAIEKHELATSGMPTEPGVSKTFDPSKAEETVTLYGREVRVKVVEDHFKGGSRGGDYTGMAATPPLSVVAEVEDMKKQVDAKVSAAGSAVAQLQYLVGLPNKLNPNKLDAGPLTLLADDFEERAAFREWLSEALRLQAELDRQPPAQRDPVAVARVTDLFGLARTALDSKFALATGKADPTLSDGYEKAKREARAARDFAFDQYQRAAKTAGQEAKQKAYLDAQMVYWKALAATSASLSDIDRRRRAAGLLAVLDPTAGGQKRTVQLVGLNDYANAVLDRTQRLSSMPERYDRQGESELASFGLTYAQKLKTSQDLDFMLQRQLDITKTFAAQEKAGAEQVVTRTAHRDAALGRTDDMDKKVKAAAAAQKSLEKEIFVLQQLVGVRFDELFQLEDQVFQAEKLKAGK